MSNLGLNPTLSMFRVPTRSRLPGGMQRVDFILRARDEEAQRNLHNLVDSDSYICHLLIAGSKS